MQPMLEPAADDQERERDHKGDRDDQPLPDAAGDADAGREPGTGGGGEPANPKMMLGMDDDAGAEKTDAGEDSLDDSAGGIGEFRGVAKTQHNLGPVKQSDVLLFKVRTAYFGTRPII